MDRSLTPSQVRGESVLDAPNSNHTPKTHSYNTHNNNSNNIAALTTPIGTTFQLKRTITPPKKTSKTNNLSTSNSSTASTFTYSDTTLSTITNNSQSVHTPQDIKNSASTNTSWSTIPTSQDSTVSSSTTGPSSTVISSSPTITTSNISSLRELPNEHQLLQEEQPLPPPPSATKTSTSTQPVPHIVRITILELDGLTLHKEWRDEFIQESIENVTDKILNTKQNKNNGNRFSPSTSTSDDGSTFSNRSARNKAKSSSLGGRFSSMKGRGDPSPTATNFLIPNIPDPQHIQAIISLSHNSQIVATSSLSQPLLRSCTIHENYDGTSTSTASMTETLGHNNNKSNTTTSDASGVYDINGHEKNESTEFMEEFEVMNLKEEDGTEKYRAVWCEDENSDPATAGKAGTSANGSGGGGGGGGSSHHHQGFSTGNSSITSSKWKGEGLSKKDRKYLEAQSQLGHKGGAVLTFETDLVRQEITTTTINENGGRTDGNNNKQKDSVLEYLSKNFEIAVGLTSTTQPEYLQSTSFSPKVTNSKSRRKKRSSRIRDSSNHSKSSVSSSTLSPQVALPLGAATFSVHKEISSSTIRKEELSLPVMGFMPTAGGYDGIGDIGYDDSSSYVSCGGSVTSQSIQCDDLSSVQSCKYIPLFIPFDTAADGNNHAKRISSKQDTGVNNESPSSSPDDPAKRELQEGGNKSSRRRSMMKRLPRLLKKKQPSTIPEDNQVDDNATTTTHNSLNSNSDHIQTRNVPNEQVIRAFHSKYSVGSSDLHDKGSTLKIQIEVFEKQASRGRSMRKLLSTKKLRSMLSSSMSASSPTLPSPSPSLTNNEEKQTSAVTVDGGDSRGDSRGDSTATPLSKDGDGTMSVILGDDFTSSKFSLMDDTDSEGGSDGESDSDYSEEDSDEEEDITAIEEEDDDDDDMDEDSVFEDDGTHVTFKFAGRSMKLYVPNPLERGCVGFPRPQDCPIHSQNDIVDSPKRKNSKGEDHETPDTAATSKKKNYSRRRGQSSPKGLMTGTTITTTTLSGKDGETSSDQSPHGVSELEHTLNMARSSSSFSSDSAIPKKLLYNRGQSVLDAITCQGASSCQQQYQTEPIDVSFSYDDSITTKEKIDHLQKEIMSSDANERR